MPNTMLVRISFVCLLFITAGKLQAQVDCDTFGYDRCINGIMYNEGINNILLSGDSTMSKPTLKSVSKIKEFQIFDATYYPFRNQYILTAGVEGSGDSYFEIGYRNAIFKKRFHIFNNENKKFVTENGVRLGMSEKRFRSKLKFTYRRFTLIRPNIRIGNSVFIIYYISCGGNPSFNQHYSAWANINLYPDYSARYIFKDGRLVKFAFGSIPYHPTLEFEDIIY